MQRFPIVLWGDTEATFLPGGAGLPAAPVRAALVFALQHGDFVLADIKGRGWSIPGGHLEDGESGEQAARREVREEIGATLGPLHLLGHYLLAPQTDESEERPYMVIAYLAEVTALDALPPGSESGGICHCRYLDLRACYYTWDVLLEAMFAYVWEKVRQDQSLSGAPPTMPHCKGSSEPSGRST